MLVLNRRPGESIVVEHGIRLTVLSVVDHKVWLVVEAPALEGVLHVSAGVLAGDGVQLDVGEVSEVRREGGEVQLRLSGEGRRDRPARATLSLLCRVGTSVAVGDGLRVMVASVAKGNPCLRLTGSCIGFPLDVTVLRAVGSYVRVGIDAPTDRRVYRKELWDDVVAANRASGTEGDDLSALVAGGPALLQEAALARPR